MSDGNQEGGVQHSVVVRSPAKIIFLYPTFLIALVAGIWTHVALSAPGATLESITMTPGRLFWWVFVINLLVLGFDFSRGAFFALLLSFGVVVLGIVLANQSWSFVRPMQELLSMVQLRAHYHFYYLIALALALIFIALFIHSRFDYWEITHNELLHHHGVLGDVERFPAPDLRMTKEITDIFEYCLLGAGRLVIQPRGSERAIVLQNVLFVRSKEDRIQRMLSTLSVTFHQQGGGQEPPGGPGPVES